MLQFEPEKTFALYPHRLRFESLGLQLLRQARLYQLGSCPQEAALKLPIDNCILLVPLVHTSSEPPSLQRFAKRSCSKDGTGYR